MPPGKKKSQNPTGLGRAIINQKSRNAQRAREAGLYTTDLDPITALNSVTQERDLDEFLNTAELAGTEFTAERQNIKIVQTPSANSSSAHNPFLLTDQEEKAALKRQRENKARLRVPRRPPWTKTMAHHELDRQERDAFLEWRRALAQLQDEENFVLTPFERNLEVWRQLWRVLERSHLVVQIVDARNPLRFRCEDLEAYVADVEGPEGEHGTGKGHRKSLLLINKSDLLTTEQRRLWANYFDSQHVRYAFYSASNAAALQAAQDEPDDVDNLSEPDSSHDGESDHDTPPQSSSQAADASDEHDLDDLYYHSEDEADSDPRTKVLTVNELEELFVKEAPDLSLFEDGTGKAPAQLMIGLVGYPNVGKSSTINSLIGAKKVSVSSTPGKTKHFQTIHLSANIVLCDCPGLVFPQFATTKAELVCDGVLPIDQMREYTGPVGLVVKRIPRAVLEGIYGLTIRRREETEGENVTAEDLLVAYAIARGFARAGQGNPDEARAARYILKDYVNAKLLYCHPPTIVDADEFNAKVREAAIKRAEGKKRAPTTRVTKNADTFIPVIASNAGSIDTGTPTRTGDRSIRASALDNDFFESQSGLAARPTVSGAKGQGQAFSRVTMYPHQNIVAADGTPLDKSAVAAAMLANGAAKGRKKHFKGNKRVKQRSGAGYD